MQNHVEFMKQALSLAKEAAALGEVPVGAIVVKDGEIVGKGYNLRENNASATAHAEIIAIEEACRTLGTWRLSGCTLYVTLEPCPMCAGAIVNARIDRVVFGAYDPKGGAFGSLLDLREYPLNHKPEVCGGVLGEECKQILTEYFKRKRGVRHLAKLHAGDMIFGKDGRKKASLGQKHARG